MVQHGAIGRDGAPRGYNLKFATVCATVYFFSTISGPFSHNLDRVIVPEIVFLNFFPFFLANKYRDYFPKYHLKIDFEQFL